MKHKSFSIEVPSASKESIEARPLLYKFDEELETHGYKTIMTRTLSDDPKSYGKGLFTRPTVTSKTMISERVYLTFETQQLIQQHEGKVFHMASIKGNISVCDEKDLEEFKQIVKSVFNIKKLELSDLRKIKR